MTVMIGTNGAELCAEAFGDRGDPAILLIHGGAASMDWWDDAFCEQLAGGGRFVIRYDHRDTGQSTSYPPGKPGYNGMDLTHDAFAVLDGLGVDRAHIVGLSMGGGIAQELVTLRPDRVLTLTFIATSPIGLPEPRELPPPRVKASVPNPDWHDREAVIRFFTDTERLYSGSIPVDEERIRTIAGRMFDRSGDVEASQTNHWGIEEGEPIQVNLGEISVPVLVLHGTEDPLFPLPHGEALAAAIPGAVLVPIEKMGHQTPPPQVWPIVIEAILRHTS
ncbi:MAG TPA: alpha/beta hydrolase [Candidatus Limnocylindrales bacterium]